jgi:hypothetical protein
MVVTQLYDIYVAAFFDSTTSKIYIIQYRPIALTAIKIGEIATTTINDQIYITEITNGDTLLPAIAISYQKFDKSSGTGYYAVSSSGVFTTSSLTTISHGSFPSNLATPRIITGPFQYMNGHNYIMTLDGFIYMSSLTTAGNPDVTTWNTNATVTASQYPDSGVGVFRYMHHLLAFGKDSVEFFNDASDPPPGSTLERTDQAFIKFGAISPRMIQNFDDTIYWIAYGSNNSFGVWKMTGYTPTKISDLKIDTILTNILSTNSESHLLNMQCIVLAARKHLLIGGVQYDNALTWFGTGAVGAADTFQITAVADGRAGVLAYSLDDKIWWGLNVLSGLYNTTYVRPATSFSTAAQIGSYRQYMFVCGSLTDGFGDARDFSGTTVQYFNQRQGSSGTYIDTNPQQVDANQNYEPITAIVCLNTYWFETERRKRINKIKTIVEGLTMTDASVYALYIVATPDTLYDSMGATSLVRRLVLPTVDQRYYDNNWGMMRAINVSVISKTKDDMRIRSVELDLAQGTA